MGNGVDIYEGMQVVGSDGEVVGTVKQMLADQRCFRVDCRHAPDYYVPYDAVLEVDGDRVLLRVSKLSAANMGWEAKPQAP